MSKTAFNVKTQEDYDSLLAEGVAHGLKPMQKTNWRVNEDDTVVYFYVHDRYMTYSSVDYYHRENPQINLLQFVAGMKLTKDSTGFHISTPETPYSRVYSLPASHVSSVDTFSYAVKETPSSVESVSDSIQHLMSVHGVGSVIKGIEHWIERNGYGATATEPVEPRYTVVLPNPNVSKGAQLIVLRKQDTQTDSKLQLSKIKQSTFDSGSELNQLTEAEIKKDFDWAWQFAQEVK